MSESNAHQRFTDLNVWKQARSVKLEVYRLVKSFPKEEKFELVCQVMRSGRSVCSNISEGHGRFTYKDQLHFCIQARGSVTETLNHMIDAFDCKYISSEELKQFEEKIVVLEKLLNGYISFLRNAGDQGNKKNG